MPFHTTTELLLKFLPFTVIAKAAPPALALFGEIEVIEGVEGQEQETTGSRKIANAIKRGNFFPAVIIAIIIVAIDVQRSAGRPGPTRPL